MLCDFCNKNKDIFKIKNKNLCLNHIKLNYNNYIIIIQKIYKGYKCRKYLKNIFYKLPKDIQDIIIDNLNYNYHEKCFKDYIKKLIDVKCKKISTFENIRLNKITLLELNNICISINKYINFIDFNTIKYYYYYFYELYNILYYVAFDDFILYNYLEYNILYKNINYKIFNSINDNLLHYKNNESDFIINILKNITIFTINYDKLNTKNKYSLFITN